MLSNITDRTRRHGALIAALLAPLALMLLLPPIPQDPQYHALADARLMLGVPHFANVASNAAFFAVGFAGVAFCLTHKPEGARLSWTVFFAAVTAVAFGSAYYHLDPSDETLVWDRLPMTVAFMALFAALLTEHLDTAHEGALLIATIIAGVASLAWWRVDDDLRLYVWIQLAPFLAIAVLLAAFPARFTQRHWLAAGLAFYVLAKFAEIGDAAIYSWTSGRVSGHTLKHVLAACAPLCVYCMLRRRTQSDRATAP